jgi:hypothetical protein
MPPPPNKMMDPQKSANAITNGTSPIGNVLLNQHQQSKSL